MSFTKYINELRLEYAAELLRDRPDYTIEAIGEECGMPIAQTFYRNFSDKFGVTPADFRHLSHKNAQKQQIMNNRDKEWRIVIRVLKHSQYLCIEGLSFRLLSTQLCKSH